MCSDRRSDKDCMQARNATAQTELCMRATNVTMQCQQASTTPDYTRRLTCRNGLLTFRNRMTLEAAFEFGLNAQLSDSCD